MITTRNIVILALMQATVIVMGVLATGLWHHFFTNNGVEMPGPAAMLYNFGVLWLLIPLAWVTAAVVMHLRDAVSDEVKVTMFWTGILILVALVVFVLYADVSPFNFMGPLHGGDDLGGGGE